MNQIEWEQKQYATNRQVILDRIKEKRAAGKSSGTKSTASVLTQQIEEVSDNLKQIVAPREKEPLRHAVLRRAAMRINKKESYEDYDVLAYIGLTTVLNKVFHTNVNLKKLTFLSDKIGGLVEIDQRLHLFEKKNPGLAVLLRNKETEKVIHEPTKAIFNNWDNYMTAWTDWSTEERIWVGSLIIHSILECMEDYLILNTANVPGQFKKAYVIDTTAAFREFVQKYDDYYIDTHIYGIPCIEQPVDWKIIETTDEWSIQGGYHTESMRMSSGFCKLKNKIQREFFYSNYPPKKHIEAMNYMQSIAWEINEDALAFVRRAIETGKYSAIPSMYKIDTGERPDDSCIEARKAWGRDTLLAYNINEKNSRKLVNIQRVLSMAESLRGKPFWFVYNTCFRGRVYCSSSTLDTQGSDYVRSLIRFRKGKPLGQAGLLWLAVHGANLYGNDKISYRDRHAWVMDNMGSIRIAATQPDSSRGTSFLRNADKPFQFYAFCCEWTKAHQLEDPTAFISHLPVGLDGSCNGLQHISALLCDEDGGSRVNLSKAPLPQDIYRDIHKRVNELLHEQHDNPLASALHANIEKDLIKSIVLSIPYGATKRGSSVAVVEYLIEEKDRFPDSFDSSNLWKMANLLTNAIYQSAYEIIVRGKELMDWFKLVAKLVSNENRQLQWITPVEFPISHCYLKYNKKAVRTTTLKNREVQLTTMVPTKEVSKHKAMQSIVANFTHGMDSSHMIMTALACLDEGINSSYVHDEYNTHACDVPFLYKALREQFASLYIPDNLESFRRQIESNVGITLPPPPPMGKWDVTEIYDATYFFG